MLIVWSKKLTTIQKLVKLKRVLLIMIMINILLVQFIELLNGLGNGLIIQSILSNQKWKTQPTLINLHPNEYNEEFHYYPFAIKLDQFVGSCKTLNDFSNK